MFTVYLRLFLTAFFWGGTFVAGRSLAGTVNPVSAAFYRFAIASLILLVITYYREGLPRMTARQCLVVLALGSSGIMAYNLFFFNGLNLINASRASLIIALNPVFIALASMVIHKESLPRKRLLGIVLSISGAIIVISHGQPFSILNEGIGRGELLIFGCVLSWTLYSVIGKTAMHGLSALATVCYSSIAGTVLLFLLVCRYDNFANAINYSFVAWLSILYLGMFGTVVGFLWYFQGIHSIGPSRAAVFINFVPVNGVFLATVLLGEPLTMSLLIGGGLVLSGSYMANSVPQQKTLLQQTST